MTDHGYELKRNKLIPLAEQKANRECGELPPGNRIEWGISWNLCFLGEMDRLAKEVGLIQ